MSGFVGIVYFDGHPVDRELLGQLTDLLAYRGPDAQHIWTDGGSVGFGHTLLRSTYHCRYDHQPLICQDGALVLVTDARIDDRSTLLQKLKGKGCSIDADAPASLLIMAAYQTWGIQAVDHLIGDFSFALWDGYNQQLFAARDHFGMRMVHYAFLPNGLIFSNEIQPILRHHDISNELNDNAIGSFLLFGRHDAFDQKYTPFAKIHALAPSERMIARRDQIIIEKYWSFPQHSSVLRYRNNKDYIHHLSSVLTEAIRDRIQCPKVMIAMSGGLDSTTVASLAADLTQAGEGPQEICALTVARGGLDDELKYASLVAKHLGINHHFFDDQRYTPLDSYPRSLIPVETPFPEKFIRLKYQSSFLGDTVLTARSADNVMTTSKLTLYAQYKAVGLVSTIKTAVKMRQDFSYVPPIGSGLLAKLKGRNANTPINMVIRPTYPYPNWLNGDFEEKEILPEVWKSFWRPRFDQSALPTQLSLELPNWHVPYANLGLDFAPKPRTDPFMDLRIIEFFLSLPPLPWFYKKTIIRELSKDKLPKEIFLRPKVGPQDAMEFFLADPKAREIDEWHACPMLERYVNRQLVSSLVDNPYSAKTYVDFRPFALNRWLNSLENF